MTITTNAADLAAKLLADAMAASNAADAAKSNSAGNLTKALNEAKALGRLAAKGALSLTDLAVRFAGWVRDGSLTEENAKQVYASYAEAFNAKLTDGSVSFTSAELLVPDAKQSVSIFRTFGREAVAKAGADWFGRVAKIAADMSIDADAGEKRLSGYNAMVRANRKISDGWTEAEKTGVSFDDWFGKVVTDAKIEAWVRGDAKAEKDAVAALMEMIAKLGKHVKKLPEALGQHVAAEVTALTDIAAKHKAGTLTARSELVTGTQADALKAALELA